ncbi:MAG: S-(hydroxymethyl)glutathione synthase [Pelagibacteraceae bacterium]|nr:S-(hydroxymethyl)glutathione synthase [Pelagibacteraceae bacterium]|tara:strand:- start:359 stop:775 length:417 start_codon:yes stop_codon:yes gene_type:complete
MNTKNNIRLAECLCGGIKMSIAGQLRKVSNCHCSMCMKTHGNFAAYTSCKEYKIKFLNKKTLRWYKSSNIAKRGFCNKCGASLFYKRNNSENISISAGMFRNPTGLKTNMNIFTKGKLDYYVLDNKIKKYHQYSIKLK